MSEEVKKMFDDISGKYDLINGVLSLGVHNRWRKIAVKMSGAKSGMSVLDCATGTGDLALEFKKTVGKNGYVLGTDFSKEMLNHAPAKSEKSGLKVDFEVADAMNLPYEDNRFDIASISFGIRNVDEPETALREMARVVKPGGRVVVLEFGQAEGIMKLPFTVYSKYVIPTVGGLLSGNKDAYTYLPETSAAFPAGSKFLNLMYKTRAYKEYTYKRLTGGIAYIYVGVVA